MTWLQQLRGALPENDLADGKLSKNFMLHEFTRSATARRRGYQNQPSDDALHALNLLVDNVLQPARDALGIPLEINSGYRCKKLNRAVGGSRRSDHLYGRAADIVTKPDDRRTLRRLARYIAQHLEFKQLIWEYGEWIHVSYQPGRNRGQILEAYKTWTGRTRFRPFSPL